MGKRKLQYVKDYRPSEMAEDDGHSQGGYTYTGKVFVPVSSEEIVCRAVYRSTFCALVGWVAYLAALLVNSNAMRTIWISLPFILCGICLWAISESLLTLRKSVPGKRRMRAVRLRKEPVQISQSGSGAGITFRQKQADRINNRYPAACFFLIVLAGISLTGAFAAAVLSGWSKWLLPGDAYFPVESAALLAAGTGLFRQRKRLLVKPAPKQTF